MRKKLLSQYYNIIIIGIIFLIIIVGVLKQQDAFVSGKNKDGVIKGVTIGNTNYFCGNADDICPSEYAACKECIVLDIDCINRCS